MFIESAISPIDSCSEKVAGIARRLFRFNSEQINSLSQTLVAHLTKLNDSLYVYIEAPYADKVYRDSYYNYFSTKFGTYSKECIRLSFFDVPLDKVLANGGVDPVYLQQHYLGFMVIRPTVPQVVGRSVLSPNALKESNFRVCTTEIPVTVNGYKLLAKGFPHSSQDNETITCAETTVWALMEYFGHRYVNYRPVLPSEILSVLRARSYERQWPSKGLAIDQISFALRELGFATRIYAQKAYNADFFALLSCYVESGIPIAVAINNNAGIGHALICIGREPINPSQLPETPVRRLSHPHNNRSIQIIDNDRMARNFVFIDDNLPAYAVADLNHPAINYPDDDWQGCVIDYFIVPLYGKVYLEAYEAKRLVEEFLLVGPHPLADGYELFLRFYLASSRSYKEYVATNATMQPELKTFILAQIMPKFIWVAELSTHELIKQNRANGVILLDATEANVFSFKPLLFAAYQDSMLIFADEFSQSTVKETIHLPIEPFLIYENNLKPFPTDRLSNHSYYASTEPNSTTHGTFPAGRPDQIA